MAQLSEKTSGTEDDQVLARLAVKHGFVSDEQMRTAVASLRQEKEKGSTATLGDFLLSCGLLTRKQLDFLERASMFLAMRQPDVTFGRVAVRTRLVTQEQVDRALQIQAQIFKDTRAFRSIGEILVQSGVLTAQKRDAIQVTIERLKKEKTPDPVAPASVTPEAPPSEAAAVSAPPSPSEPPSQPGAEPQPPDSIPPVPSGADDEGVNLDDARILVDEVYFEILVTADGLKAYLKIKDQDLPDRFGSESIKGVLESKGITQGVVDQTLIDGYLRHKGAQQKPLCVAQGVPPTPGRHAEIRRYFNTKEQPLYVSDQDDGPIDLKNRGVIPQVKQGDIIAEKIPRVSEIPGTDIFGKKIATEQAKDAKLSAGPGAEISHDGLKVLAKVDGRPQMDVYGIKICVLPELHIQGDVGFESGNVAFEGIVYVQGIVQDGFKVKGRGLVAKEIAKAEVDITGDITVHGGILGADIKCQGTVRAVHIHTAKIEAQGGVIVEKGIFHSKISTSGKCVAERGKIISSKIIAKQGVEAHTIGSELSHPSSFLVGIDPVTEKEIERLKGVIAAKHQEKSKIRDIIEKLNEQSRQAELRIGELAQVQDRGALKKRSFLEKLEELKKAEDGEKVAKIEGVLAELEGKIKEAEVELDRLFGLQDEIRDRIAGYSEKIKEADREIAEVNDELDAINDWIMEHPGVAAVKVLNMAFSGTVIRGPFSSVALTTNVRGSLIREARESDVVEGGSPNRWKMHVQGLR